MAHIDSSKHILEEFAEKLSDIAVVEKAPKLEGRSMMMFLLKNVKIKKYGHMSSRAVH